ncbi:MAG: hypothetical protein QMD50_03635 [Patescibacteria group bacterium]|nr:hypothetical protein [Patescibacteria group bacterium]
MATRKMVKFFSVEERTIEGAWYQIIVKDESCRVVDRFEKPTQKEAWNALEAAGYRDLRLLMKNSKK